VTTIVKNTLLAVPFEEYNTDTTAVRKTWLDLINQTPAHLVSHLTDPPAPTPALAFGQLVHVAILEPDSLIARYYSMPKLDRRKTADKALYAELREKHAGKIEVSEDDMARALAMRDSVYRHKGARMALNDEGDFEQSIFWTNAETGELCKARYDKIAPRRSVPFAADVKTTIDASPAAFAKAVINYNYHLQHAHYIEPLDVRFVFIAVEKTPPYAVACYASGDDTLKLGKDKRDPLMRLYAECKAKNEWPAYPQSIQRLTLPRWAR
jgi:hypothetical protein